MAEERVQRRLAAILAADVMDATNADLPEDRRIVLRIGINLGDVMVEGSDLYGDGVNIAAHGWRQLRSQAASSSLAKSGWKSPTNSS